MADKVLRPVEYSDETQELFRNSLLKLNARIGDLGPIENVKGCSFNYQIFVNERGAKAVTDNHTEVRFPEPYILEELRDNMAFVG